MIKGFGHVVGAQMSLMGLAQSLFLGRMLQRQSAMSVLFRECVFVLTLEAMTSASGISEEEDSDVMEDNSVENDGDDDSDSSSDDAEEDMEEEEDDDEFDTNFFDAPNEAAPLGGGINDSDG